MGASRKKIIGAGEMVQQLIALAVFAEDPGSIPVPIW